MHEPCVWDLADGGESFDEVVEHVRDLRPVSLRLVIGGGRRACAVVEYRVLSCLGYHLDGQHGG